MEFAAVRQLRSNVVVRVGHVPTLDFVSTVIHVVGKAEEISRLQVANRCLVEHVISRHADPVEQYGGPQPIQL